MLLWNAFLFSMSLPDCILYVEVLSFLLMSANFIFQELFLELKLNMFSFFPDMSVGCSVSTMTPGEENPSSNV